MDQKLALLASLTIFSSSGSAFAQYTAEPVSSPGAISGRVRYAGPPPTLAPEARDKNPEVCGSSHDNQTLQIGPDRGLGNTVVFLKDVRAGKAMAPVSASLDQRGCTYVPHLQTVPVGSTLELLNSDPLLHNIHASQSGSTVFNYAMPQSVKRIPKRLTRPGFLTIKCDVHAWMNGVVAVMDNPYYAVTDSTGAFTIEGVPPGSYTLEAWQERLGDKTAPVSVAAGQTVTVDFTFSEK